jgi:hypothetical protein
MAVLCTFKNSDFTETNGFRLVHSGASFSWSDAATQTVTTALVATPNFTFASSTNVDGIGIMLQTRSLTPSGDFIFQVFNASTSTVVYERVIPVSDLIASASPEINITGELVFYQFPTITFATGTNYQIRVRTTVAGNVALFRNATTNNFSRFLRTTTTATMAATDTLYVHGERLDAGGTQSYTITMNNNTTTQYGQIGIGGFGTLSFATNQDTKLYVQGDIHGVVANGKSIFLYGGGTFLQGSESDRILNPYTSLIYYNSTGNAQSGMWGYGNMIAKSYGQQRTANWTLLTSNVSALDTIIQVDNINYDISDWVVGDSICISGTSRALLHQELRTISAISGGSITLNSGLTNARIGTGIEAATVANLTRNIKWEAPSSTFSAGTNFTIHNEIDFNNIQMINFTSATRAAFQINMRQGAKTSIRHNSRVGSVNGSFFFNQIIAAPHNNLDISHNVVYNTLGAWINNTSPTTQFPVVVNSKIDGNVFMGASSSGSALSLNDDSMDFTNNRVLNTTLSSIFGSLTGTATFSGRFSDNFIQCVGVFQLSLSRTNLTNKPAQNNIFINSASYGIGLYNSRDSILENTTVLGSATGNILLGTGSTNSNFNLVVKNLTCSRSQGFTTPVNIRISAATISGSISYNNTEFVNANLSESTLADIDIAVNDDNSLFEVFFDRLTQTSSNFLINQNFMSSSSRLGFQRLNGSTNDHRTYHKDYVLFCDSSIKNKGLFSSRFEPDTAFPRDSYNKQKAARQGKAEKISVHIRKSATYNGMQPELWVKSNSSLGLNNETILATCTSGAEVWEKIEATLPVAEENGVWTFYLRFSGTAGFINVDTWK